MSNNATQSTEYCQNHGAGACRHGAHEVLVEVIRLAEFFTKGG
jgi:hypothetical protein